MELYPKTPFSELAISRSERFWLWLAGSNARWRSVLWIVAIFWTGILAASGSDSPQLVALLTLASWCSVVLCHLSHALLSILARQTRDADPKQKSKGEGGALNPCVAASLSSHVSASQDSQLKPRSR